MELDETSLILSLPQNIDLSLGRARPINNSIDKLIFIKISVLSSSGILSNIWKIEPVIKPRKAKAMLLYQNL